MDELITQLAGSHLFSASVKFDYFAPASSAVYKPFHHEKTYPPSWDLGSSAGLTRYQAPKSLQ